MGGVRRESGPRRPRFQGEVVEPLPDDDEATLGVSVLMGQVALGVSAGVPMPELLDLAGKTPTEIVDPDQTVPYANALGVLERVQRALGERPVSLALLEMMPPSVFGMTDLASQSASSVGDAVEIYLRFARLTSSHAQSWLARDGELAAVRLRHLAMVEDARHPVEIGIGLSVKLLLRCGLDPSEILEVHLARSPVGAPELYRAVWGERVFFESFGNAVVVHESTLSRPLKHADPLLSRSLLARLSAELSELEGEDSLSAFRREVAAHARPAHYNAAAVAKRMGRSLRSLQREASKVGTKLSVVIDDLRVARARELLRDSTLSVDEVGFLVDYSERAAFSRAFKRATGQTPVEWRRALGAK